MDSSSTPLADYFWIAGIENISYDDGYELQDVPTNGVQEETIVEDGEGEALDADTSVVSSSRATARHSRQNSGNRLSTMSKLSVQLSLNGDGRPADDMDGNTTSNRSSATIRPVPPPNSNISVGTNGVNGTTNGNPLGHIIGQDGFLADFDFDKALFKFAAERENFLDDLTFSAGAKIQSRPLMVNPRTEKLKAEDTESGRKSPLKSIRGSIRRKISFREMTSARKQPLTPKAGNYMPPSLKITLMLTNPRQPRFEPPNG